MLALVAGKSVMSIKGLFIVLRCIEPRSLPSRNMLWDDGAVLAPVPREIPPSLSLALRFGGPMGMLGWTFFGFGTIFVCVFFSFKQTYRSFQLDLGALETQGSISGWQVTNMQVNNQEGVANHYTYRLQGTSYDGVSYKNGVGLPMDSAVTVEFLSRNPAVSRIKGMRVSHTPAWAILLVGAFPLIGLIFIVTILRRGRRRVRLLRVGLETDGRVLSHEFTGTKINEEPQFSVTFAYKLSDGIERATAFKTVEVSELLDDSTELILYDPKKPNCAMPIDGMPDLVHLKNDGRFAVVSGQHRLRIGIPVCVAAVTVLATLWRNI